MAIIPSAFLASACRSLSASSFACLALAFIVSLCTAIRHSFSSLGFSDIFWTAEESCACGGSTPRLSYAYRLAPPVLVVPAPLSPCSCRVYRCFWRYHVARTNAQLSEMSRLPISLASGAAEASAAPFPIVLQVPHFVEKWP
jgi:hypothetical protein